MKSWTRLVSVPCYDSMARSKFEPNHTLRSGCGSFGIIRKVKRKTDGFVSVAWCMLRTGKD
jgi:hypothetical protein